MLNRLRFTPNQASILGVAHSVLRLVGWKQSRSIQGVGGKNHPFIVDVTELVPQPHIF